jgi:hypothetical protein
MGVVVGTGGLRQDASAGSGKRGTTNGFDPAGAKPVSIAPPVSTATQAKPDTTPSPTATHEYSADTVSVQITSTPSWDPNLTSALTPPEPSPSNVVGVVSKMVSGVVSAVLNPFAATDTPGAPADAPSMWALLAVARREFENALQSPSVTDAAVNLQTTSETVPDAACNPNGAR